mgnify:CR=1 FL=1
MSNDIKRAPVAVILATGTGAHFGAAADKSPACLRSVGGSVILERTLRNCLSCGISQFVLVLGHRADEIRQFVDKTFRGIRVTYVTNTRYDNSGSAQALLLARQAIGMSEFVKFDAKVVFEVRILRRLLDSNETNVLCMNSTTPSADNTVKVITDDPAPDAEADRTITPELAFAAAIGIEKIAAKTGARLFAELAQIMDDPMRSNDPDTVAYARLSAAGTPFHALDIAGLNWVRIDSKADFDAANAMFGSPVTTVSRGQERAIDAATHKHTESL